MNIKNLKTKKRKSKKIIGGTIANSISNSNEKESITLIKIFFELLFSIKMFHWDTSEYSAHKASDDLFQSLNSHIDKFVEIFLGKVYIKRFDFESFSIKIKNLKTKTDCFEYITKCKNTFENIEIYLPKNYNGDLLNIRDEIIGDLNQFLYLLSFK